MCFLFFSFFKAVGAAYESSQAGGQITAAAVSLHHSHSNDPSHICDLDLSLRQSLILNSLSKTRERTPHPPGEQSGL